jgi:hypothetical protein
MVAPAFHGAKKLLQACLAYPGVLMFKWISSGRMPIQYPNRDQVGKLDDQPVTAANSMLAQEVRNLVGSP